jgi:hypothetical protein
VSLFQLFVLGRDDVIAIFSPSPEGLDGFLACFKKLAGLAIDSPKVEASKNCSGNTNRSIPTAQVKSYAAAFILRA